MNEDMDWVKAVAAFIFVLGLLGCFAVLLKHLSARGFTFNRKGPQYKRLRIVETLPVDARRRFVIVRCDKNEHLLLLGNEGDLVIDTNIPPAKGQNTP